MGKTVLILLVFLCLGFNPVLADEPQRVELTLDLEVTFPQDWEIADQADEPEILRLGDMLNNAIFSLFRYELAGTSLAAFADYMIDYFTEEGWEKTGEIEEYSWDGIGDGLILPMESQLGEEETLVARFIFFRIEDNYFLGRLAVAGQVWAEYTEDWELIRENIRVRD